ncbi:MAG TPA: class I SAM-dependent methyltransferase [Thermoanaerobaculia bacterium]|nr:class I SAM-dependent methyltransferase [Thermoanaerobaculia bacterium]
MAEPYEFKAFAGSSHLILIRLIRRWAPRGRLLDLGSWTGDLGAAVRDHFAKTFALERSVSNLPELRRRFDSVLIADLELTPQLPPSLDAIVLADVLEHVRGPQELLACATKVLSPGGKIFISIPNVANVAIRVSLLFGRFEYAEKGILDSTHLRFFTRASARRLIRSAGLVIQEETVSSVPIRLAFPRAPGVLISIAEKILLLVTPLLPTLLGYQFIFVAADRDSAGGGRQG